MKKINYLIIFIFYFVVGCATITNPTPDIINCDVISYDNGQQNAGIIQTYTFFNNGEKIEGFIITENAKIKYNTLIEKYGNRFIPELKKNDGIINININNKIYYFISAQYMIKFADMVDYYRLNRYYQK